MQIKMNPLKIKLNSPKIQGVKTSPSPNTYKPSRFLTKKKSKK